MSDERPFHERDLYRDNDFMGLHADECAIVEWWEGVQERDKPDCTCAFGRLIKQLEGVK